MASTGKFSKKKSITLHVGHSLHFCGSFLFSHSLLTTVMEHVPFPHMVQSILTEIVSLPVIHDLLSIGNLDLSHLNNLVEKVKFVLKLIKV